MFEQAFIEYVQYERRRSLHTVAAYKRDLEQFVAFLAKEMGAETPGDITHLMIRAWLVSLLEAGVTPRSVNRKLSAIKTYFHFLLREGHLQKDPTLKVLAPKIARKLPVFAEVGQLQNALDRHPFPEGYEGILQRCLVEILWATGMRRAEVLGLAYDAVDLSGGLLRVLGKGNKERMVPLAPAMVTRLEAYKRARSALAASEGTFFRLPNGKPLYAAYVYRVVKNVLGVHTQLKKRSPHVLRHSFATHVLDAGADLNAIKTMLGHANLAATQVYTHNTISKLKHVHGKAHPRGGDEG